MQCNELSECECKSDLITGAKCDECAFGYHGFPECTGNIFWFSSQDPLKKFSNSSGEGELAKPFNQAMKQLSANDK